MPPVSSSATIQSNRAPSNFEDQVTFLVTVTGASFNVAPPSGTVNFFDGISPIGSVTLTPVGPLSSQSTATLDITILGVGVHEISAIYLGDANYTGTTALPDPFLQQVNAVASAAPLVSGFSIIASFQPNGDSSLPPQATLYAVPIAAHSGDSITLLWDTINVGQIEITGTNGTDYIGPGPLPTSPLGFDTGRITTTGSGVYIVGNGFTHTIVLTLTAYDATGHPLGITSAVQVTIS